MKQKSKFGWLELILGILLIALGVYAFANPGTALGGAVMVYGFLAIITGIADIVLYVKLERRTGFGPTLSLVAGILSIIAGILILFNPGAGQLMFTIFFPIWFIAHSVSRLMNAGYTRLVAGTAYSVFSIVINILGIILGIMMLFRPWISVLSIGWLVGIYLVLLGVGSIVKAFNKPVE